MEPNLGGRQQKSAFGSNPKGINTFDAKENFSLIIMRPDIPKISAGDPEKPTAEEAAAIAKGAIAYFGTYTVNESDRSIRLKLTATTLANQLGVEQKRAVMSINAKEMKYTNPVSVRGGNIEVVWKRAQ